MFKKVALLPSPLCHKLFFLLTSVTRWLYYFFNFCPFVTIKMCPVALINHQSRFIILTNIKLTPQTFAKDFLKCCHFGEISPNLVTLLLLLTPSPLILLLQHLLLLLWPFYHRNHLVNSLLCKSSFLIYQSSLQWSRKKNRFGLSLPDFDRRRRRRRCGRF